MQTMACWNSLEMSKIKVIVINLQSQCRIKTVILKYVLELDFAKVANNERVLVKDNQNSMLQE